MNEMNNKHREGHFTSSMVYKLIKKGAKGKEFSAPGLTYIQERKIERRLQTCIDGGAYTQALAWGNFMELVIYNILGMHYHIASKETLLHTEYGKFWSGSADLYTLDKEQKKVSIAEIKCYQKKAFALYSDCLLKKDVKEFKVLFPKEYWQIVSNAIINNVDIGEAIVYMPYVSEADEIKKLAENYEGPDAWKYRFIYEKDVSELAFLPDGGYYKNINKFAFIIPQEDKDYLTERIILANKYLDDK